MTHTKTAWVSRDDAAVVTLAAAGLGCATAEETSSQGEPRCRVMKFRSVAAASRVAGEENSWVFAGDWGKGEE